MSDTIKFRRYSPAPRSGSDIADGICRDPFTPRPLRAEDVEIKLTDLKDFEVRGDIPMSKCSGKVFDYGDISPRTTAHALKDMAIHTMDAMAYAVLFGQRAPPKPLTRRQRVELWFSSRWDRVVLAWRVLRGDNIHEDC